MPSTPPITAVVAGAISPVIAPEFDSASKERRRSHDSLTLAQSADDLHVATGRPAYGDLSRQKRAVVRLNQDQGALTRLDDRVVPGTTTVGRDRARR